MSLKVFFVLNTSNTLGKNSLPKLAACLPAEEHSAMQHIVTFFKKMFLKRCSRFLGPIKHLEEILKLYIYLTAITALFL